MAHTSPSADSQGEHWLREWITWARATVHNEAHNNWCDALRQRARPGATMPADDGADAPDLRWPGYVGTHYARDGILCVSNIHTRFQSGGLRAASSLVRHTVAAHRGWIDGTVDDVTWLNAIRTMYHAGLQRGGWRVASGYRIAWARLGEDAESIAYVNAARCQWAGMSPPGALYNECLDELPLEPLIYILRPRLVLTTSPALYERWIGRDEIPVVYFHQLNGTLLRPLAITTTPSISPPSVSVGATEWAQFLADVGLHRSS